MAVSLQDCRATSIIAVDVLQEAEHGQPGGLGVLLEQALPMLADRPSPSG